MVLSLFAIGFTAMSRFTGSAGAFYVYITRGLGRPAGMGAAYLAVLSYNSIQISLYGAFAVFARDTIKSFTGVVIPWPILVLVAIAVITVLGYRNLSVNANVLAVALSLEVLILAVLAVAVLVRGGGPDGLTLQPFNPSTLLTPGAGAMFAFTFLSFIGFEATVIFGEEVRDPAKTIPKATFIAIGFLAVFYAFVTWAVVSAFGLEGAVTEATKNPTGMYFDAIEQYVGPWARNVMDVLILTSLLAVLLAFHNAVARYQFSMAREGIMPKALARVHPKHHSPFVSSISQSVFALVVVAPFIVLGLDPFLDFYVPVTTPGIYGVLALQLLTAVAVIAYFAKNGRGLSRWRTAVSPAIGALGLLVILIVAIANVAVISGRHGFINWVLAGINVVVFVFGVVLALALRRRRSPLYDRFGQEPEARIEDETIVNASVQTLPGSHA